MNKREYRGRVAAMITTLRNRAAETAPTAAVCADEGLTLLNADGDVPVLRIYDEISWYGVTALDVIAELDKITEPAVRVELNSPGGDVFDGIAIHNALRAHQAVVTVRVDGIAASIASVIAQAGDVRIMQPAAQMMIHNAWGLVVGDHNDHSEMAELLAQQDQVIAGIYAARSGRPVDEFTALMEAETWLTDQAAVDAGLADQVATFNNVTTSPQSTGITTGNTTVTGSSTNTVTIITTDPAPAPVPARFGSDLEIAANAHRRRR